MSRVSKCVADNMLLILSIIFNTLVVGITGFEPATSCSRNMRATKLRHIPNTTITCFVLWFFVKNGEPLRQFQLPDLEVGRQDSCT